jgi:hypothetical protein
VTERESAVEHLRNAQALARSLEELLTRKDLRQLAADVAAIETRIVRALDEMALGNLGRAAITSDGRQSVGP